MKLIPARALLLGSLATLLTFRSAAELSDAEARKYVSAGARIVDVRTVEEFQTKHLTNVINIPLDNVKTQFPKQFTNKSEVILLHCRSGRRSGIAENELRAMGYTKVFNMGSFERAEQLLSSPKN